MMPSSRMLSAATGLVLVWGVAVAWPDASGAAWLVTILLVAASVLDLVLSPSLTSVRAHRETKPVLSVGARNVVSIHLSNTGRQAVRLIYADEPPQPCQWEPATSALISLLPGETAVTSYHVTPLQRGNNQFSRLHLRAPSRLGFWQLAAICDLTTPVRIYPDVQAVQRTELLARQNRLAEAGVRLSRIRGRGSEFDRLREYRREDEYRSIDWKATARAEKLVSREYVVERNQSLLLLVDAGRSMCNTDQGVTHFDRALNAALLLAYVALRQGDTVGMLIGAQQVLRWVKPVRGVAGARQIVRQIYDVMPTQEATDYGLLVDDLRRRCPKRSLVIAVTHALDDVHLQNMAREFRRLRKPHLVLTAFLRNIPLQERLQEQPSSDLEAYQIAATAELLLAQQTELAKLERTGLLVVESRPDELSSRLISQYLEVKARHLL